MAPVRLAVLTVSDTASRGRRVDTSGDAVVEWADRLGFDTVHRDVVPDEADRITDRLKELCEDGAIDLVVTTGGTGFTARDVTPEATRAAIEREAPGVAEAIRAAGGGKTPTAWLSRGVAGIRGRTLIVNLPGSPGGVRDGLAVLETVAAHAAQLLRGHDTHMHPDHG